jgi:hypothetical protein
MATKRGKIIGAIAGGAAGFLVGGPPGAAIGATLAGGAGHGVDTQMDAAKTVKKEAKIQSEVIRGQAIKAEKIAKEQAAQAERSLRKISEGRVRATQRRVRGGLFGDASNTQQYGMAERLGG